MDRKNHHQKAIHISIVHWAFCTTFLRNSGLRLHPEHLKKTHCISAEELLQQIANYHIVDENLQGDLQQIKSQDEQQSHIQ